jgi:hypothetical protein
MSHTMYAVKFEPQLLINRNYSAILATLQIKKSYLQGSDNGRVGTIELLMF